MNAVYNPYAYGMQNDVPLELGRGAFIVRLKNFSNTTTTRTIKYNFDI